MVHVRLFKLASERARGLLRNSSILKSLGGRSTPAGKSVGASSTLSWPTLRVAMILGEQVRWILKFS